MAELIFGPAPAPVDPIPLRARIESLKREPREMDPEWWNDLAGAFIRLGQPAEAVKLLEPAVAKFPNDYGVHANLGTAYHLLGRYKDAEREIARDLELNPDGHFGLEKYHLALLQYLCQDAEYQKQHVYVDEFSAPFAEKWDDLSLMLTPQMVSETNSVAEKPAYREKWNLATDTNLQEGVMYMASLNPREPACFVMLGVSALNGFHPRDRDLHIAIAAFEKAIQLGSPQKELLLTHIAEIKSHLQHGAPSANRLIELLGGLTVFVLCLVVGLLIWMQLRKRAKSAAKGLSRK